MWFDVNAAAALDGEATMRDVELGVLHRLRLGGQLRVERVHIELRAAPREEARADGGSGVWEVLVHAHDATPFDIDAWRAAPLEASGMQRAANGAWRAAPFGNAGVFLAPKQA